ncbi:MAG: tRNA (N6-threonylcarbamoyladenosine(37)-N6)-methyltransferase TrmO [Bacillota bacterium]
MEFNKIGEVKSSFFKAAVPKEMRKKVSEIVIKEEYLKGLEKLEESNYLVVIFAFHLAEGFDLIGKRRYGGERGVFASRSPRRPNPIGVTTVKLLAINENIIKVKGLDALNGTPVLDIKPYSVDIDTAQNFK